MSIKVGLKRNYVRLYLQCDALSLDIYIYIFFFLICFIVFSKQIE